jgi:AraC family transcriptional regulator
MKQTGHTSIEVLMEGRAVGLIPSTCSLNSGRSGWDGIALESFNCLPGLHIAEHEHPAHLLSLLTGNAVDAEWTWEGQTHRVTNDAGTIYLLPRGTRDTLTWRNDSSRVLVAIEPKFLAESVEETSHLDDVALLPNWALKDRHITTLMLALHADLEDQQPAGRLYGEMLGATLAAYLVKRYAARAVKPRPAQGGLPGARLKRILDYVEANYTTDIRLRDLAGLANMSPHHFSEQFRRSLGMSPHRYVIERRIEHAKRMLRDSRVGILEIALATGFADQSHFTKMFRMSSGITPRAFREQA